MFPTGFAANLGILTALAAVGDTEIFSDELNHASIIDGARLSRAPIRVFAHRDVTALDRMLHETTAARSIVVSDAVFSMDGDAATIDELFAVCRAHGAMLVLDEAHSVLAPPLPDAGDLEMVIVGTLSKTLGALGGFVAGSRRVVDLCINAARSFIFTTAPTPADCAAALRALEILQSDEGAALKARLRANVEIVRPGHDSPIIPLIVGSERRAVDAAAALLERGLLVPAIRPPTVAPGTCRLRVAMSAAHDPDDAQRLRAALDVLDLT